MYAVLFDLDINCLNKNYESTTMDVTEKIVSFKKGDKVLISPQVTGDKDWIIGTIIKLDENPFVGLVINVQTEDGNIFFDKEYLFKPVNRKPKCLQ